MPKLWIVSDFGHSSILGHKNGQIVRFWTHERQKFFKLGSQKWPNCAILDTRETEIIQTWATKMSESPLPVSDARFPICHRYDSTCSSPNWSVNVRVELGTRPRNTVIPFMPDTRSFSVTQLPVRISLPSSDLFVVVVIMRRAELDLEWSPSLSWSEFGCKKWHELTDSFFLLLDQDALKLKGTVTILR